MFSHLYFLHKLMSVSHTLAHLSLTKDLTWKTGRQTASLLYKTLLMEGKAVKVSR